MTGGANFSSRCVSHPALKIRGKGKLVGRVRMLSKRRETKKEAPEGLGVRRYLCALCTKRCVDVQNEYKFWRENATLALLPRNRHGRDYPIRGSRDKIFPECVRFGQNEFEVAGNVINVTLARYSCIIDVNIIIHECNSIVELTGRY